MTQTKSLLLVLLTVAFCFPGCASDSGAAPGGPQDNEFANQQVEAKGVPKPEAFTVEGMLNSHDLPLENVPCTQELCVNAAYGIAPTIDRQRSSVFLQLGFSSGIERATFRRAPLNLAVVVDRSAAMQGESMLSIRSALSKLIDRLGDADRLSIVLFNQDVTVLLPSTPVSDRESIRALLGNINEGGSADMEAGLRAGYEQVNTHAGAAGVWDRVMLFTDAQGNAGTLKPTVFSQLAFEYGQKGIGLTVFGVGTKFNQDLVLAITKERGGNYDYLSDAQKIATVFDTDFDGLVTPLAYDLRLRLKPAAAFSITTVYGYSAWTIGNPFVEIDVPTLFLSRKHGAVIVRMDPRSGWPTELSSPLADLSLEYTNTANSPTTETKQVAYAGGDSMGEALVFYSERGVRKSVALVNAALGMRSACASYWNGDRNTAHATLTRTRDLLIDESEALGDFDLSNQAATAQQLDANMSETDTQASPRERRSKLTFCSVTLRPHQGGQVMAVGGLLGLAFLLRRRTKKSVH